MKKTLLLTELPRRLAAEGYQAPGYFTCRRLILDGAIPAEKDARGRWTVAPADLTRIAEALGCERLQPSAAA